MRSEAFHVEGGDVGLSVLFYSINRTEHMFCVHEDNTVGFAEWITKEIGVKAYAPKLGEEYFI